jgi:hypothetical protein
MFQTASLAELGLVIQLNHRRSPCLDPNIRDFTIHHTNGTHRVKLSFCGCRSHIIGNSHVAQLFNQRWMPATWKRPRTAFSFALLNQFHVLNLQSKCNLYDFYCTLKRYTNNAGLTPLPVCRSS